MAYHSKEAVLATLIALSVLIIVGCTALHIAIEVEVNMIEAPEEEPEEEPEEPPEEEKPTT